jgi:Arc/MetJ family transcription regulator
VYSRWSVPSRMNLPYIYGMIGCMKKTLNIDEELLKEAKEACGAITDTEAVHKGLEALVRRAAIERIRAYLGSEPNAVDVRRWREKPATKRRAK